MYLFEALRCHDSLCFEVVVEFCVCCFLLFFQKGIPIDAKITIDATARSQTMAHASHAW